MNNSTRVLEKQDTGTGTGFGDYQVILYNDNHNTCEHVAGCLMTVFGHSFDMATKIMLEAHRKGRTIAQVEGRDDAVRHCGQLVSKGLESKVEKI